MATSAGTGFWDVGATWVGGVVPTDAATVLAAHTITIRTAVTLGTTAAEGTVILTIAGTLTRAAGGSLTIKGDYRVENGFLDFSTGGFIRFGNGGAGQKYRGLGSSATGQTSTRMALGSAGNPCIVDKESGAGDWRIERGANNASYWLGLSAVGEWYDGGNAGFSYGNTAVEINPSGALQEARLDVKMVRCGGLNVVACPAARHCNIRLKIEQPKNAPGTVFNVFINATAPTTGERVFSAVAPHSYIAYAGSIAGFTSDYLICAREVDAAAATGLPALRKDRLWLPRATGAPTSAGAIGETIANWGAFLDCGLINAHMLDGSQPSGAGTITLDRGVFGGSAPWEEDDYFGPQSTSSGGPYNYHLKRVLMTLNSRGLPAGCIHSAHGTALTDITTSQCTGGVHENIGPNGRAWFCFNVGAEYRGRAGMIPASHSHLIYAPALVATVGGWMHLCYSGSSVATASQSNTGSAAASSTATRIVCTGKLYKTNVQQKLSDSGAKAVITGNTLGTGPPVGEQRTISNNGADWFDVSSPWSATPNTGTQFRIFVLDIFTEGMSGYSVLWNVKDGTNFQADGITTFVAQGVEGFTVSNPAALTAGNVNLGSGPDMVGAGPKFVDPTRNYVNYPNRYLGPAGLLSTPADWANATVYALGDRRKAQTSGWYANEVLWYRCVTAHTSATATDKPGSGSAWRTKWEFDFVGAVCDLVWAGTLVTDVELALTNVNYIVHLLDWIRRGWAPRNVAVIGAGYGGLDAGAVPYYGAAFDSSGPVPFGGSATMSPAQPPPFDSAGPVAFGGSASMSVIVGMDSTGPVLFGGSASIAPITLPMTGVGSLIRAVKTDRPLLLRVPPSPPITLFDSSGPVPFDGSADFTAATVFDSIAAVPFGGSASMTVGSPFDSSGPVPFGGSASMSVIVGMDSSGAVEFGGSGTYESIDSGPADLNQLITDLGGLYAAYDVRAGMSEAAGVVSALDDARGASGFGPQLAQATAGKRPLWDGTTINFDGVDDVLVSAAVAGLSLDTSRSMAFIGAVNGGTDRYTMAILNAAGTQYMAIFTQTNIVGRHDDSGPAKDQTIILAKGTTIRCVVTQQQSGTRAMATRGKPAAAVTTPVPTGTVAVSNKLLAIGGFADVIPVYGTPKFRAALVSPAGVYWTSTQWDLISTWAATNHAAIET